MSGTDKETENVLMDSNLTRATSSHRVSEVICPAVFV